MSKCRLCDHPLTIEFIDLVNAPPSNAFLKLEQLNKAEIFFPLKVLVCDECLLVQVDEFQSARNIFSDDYVYFSSYSNSWLEHCKKYAALVSERFKLNSLSQVIELASNDGYLLQYFQANGIPVLGIEPTRSTAEVAIQKGIETEIRFFGQNYAEYLVKNRKKADLLIANNVLAHVPDINDFIQGVKTILSEEGVFTAEFPHVLHLVKLNQFDTIYHEHFSYFSLLTLAKIFKKHGLRIFDVEELTTHGGSLRIYVDHGNQHALCETVDKLIREESKAGMDQLSFYAGFQTVADRVKNSFLSFLLDARKSDKKVAAYGAAAKGNTFLNYCGIKKDLIQFVVDASPHKQGRFLPGSHIPVFSETELRRVRPAYVVIFPWNLKDEITVQLSYIKEWGGKFVVAIPELVIY